MGNFLESLRVAGNTIYNIARSNYITHLNIINKTTIMWLDVNYLEGRL